MNKHGSTKIGKYISILHRQEQKYVSTCMKEYGLASPSYSFLSYLADNEGISQRELCSILVVDDALASRTMKDLERQGYIIRKRSDTDSRSYLLYLTDKAKDLVPKLVENYESWWETGLAKLKPEEQILLAEQLRIMAQTIVALQAPEVGSETIS